MIDHATAAPGWYRLADGTMRYWDGHEWLEPTMQAQPATADSQEAPRKKSRAGALVVGISLSIVAIIVWVLLAFNGMLTPGVIIDHGAGPLASDIDLGEARDLGHGNAALPVLVTNTTGATADYRMEIYGIDDEGQQHTQNWVTFDRVGPGETARADILLLPSTIYALRNAERMASPAGTPADKPGANPTVRQTAPVARDDASVGAPRDLGYGNTAIPVSVTNTTSSVYDYTVTFNNDAPHQAVNEWTYTDGTGENWTVSFHDVAPGQTVTAEAVLTITEVSGDSLRITSVERTRPGVD